MQQFRSKFVFVLFVFQTLSGVLCLHRRNYKPILVDPSDWIYVECLSCSPKFDSSDDSNSTYKDKTTPPNEKSYLRTDHLLKHVEITHFNLFIEYVSGSTTNHFKPIIYLQIDLSKCVFPPRLDQYTDLLESRTCEECRLSLLKTKGLIQMVKPSPIEAQVNDIVNETLNEDESINNPKYC